MLDERMVTSFDGTPIYASSEGDGPAVVLCDGLGCDGFIWRYLRPALLTSYRVVHWNLRGHGQSGTPEARDALGIEASRQDVMAVLDAFGLDRVALGGHSMGVQVTCEVALRHPERVAALVSICGAYGQPLTTFHNVNLLGRIWPWVNGATARFPEAARWLWKKTLASELLYRYATAFEVSAPLVERRDLQPYFDHLLRMDVEVFARMAAAAERHSVEDELERIVAPTLVIGGAKDTFTPTWIARRMARLVPGAELCVLPGGTHVAPIELPEMLWLTLEPFLHRHLPRDERSRPLDEAQATTPAPRRRRRTARAPLESTE